MTTEQTGRTGPKLVVVCGLPGVGKTTVAERVAERTDGRLLRTDVVRKERFPEPEYTAAETRTVYSALFERARETIDGGSTAVLDGTFREQSFRREARDLADGLEVPFELLKVECSEQRVAERIASREGDASDADFQVHAQLRDAFEPVVMDHGRVDNSGTLAATRRQVDRRF